MLGVLTENDEKAYVIGSVAAKTSEKEVILREPSMRIAVFASGNGSNFQAIAEAIASGEVDATIAFLFCDKPAYAIERAKQHNIPVISFTPKGFADQVAYENEILKHLAEEKVDLVVLAGYMRIVGPTLLSAYADRIVNIHLALPDFPGRHGIQDAFRSRRSGDRRHRPFRR